MRQKWTQWRRFPDPRKLELLTAPFGPGCYELRDGAQLVLFGTSSHLAQRMTSLLPAPFGSGTRNNQNKRAYVLEHLDSIEIAYVAVLSLATFPQTVACSPI
jgi:hypothetical protein